MATFKKKKETHPEFSLKFKHSQAFSFLDFINNDTISLAYFLWKTASFPCPFSKRAGSDFSVYQNSNTKIKSFSKIIHAFLQVNACCLIKSGVSKWQLLQSNTAQLWKLTLQQQGKYQHIAIRRKGNESHDFTLSVGAFITAYFKFETQKLLVLRYCWDKNLKALSSMNISAPWQLAHRTTRKDEGWKEKCKRH